MEAIQLKSIQDLYAFVESAIEKTGFILDSDALYRPWARALDARGREVRWLYPAEPLSQDLLRHLGNFSHEPVTAKGFVLIEMGRVLKAVDVNAVRGSEEPHRLCVLVQEIFAAKGKSGKQADRERGSTTRTTSTDAYRILGATETDSNQEIKRKYRELLLQYHPDRVAHLGVELRELASRKTTEINMAFAMLRRIRGLS